MRRISAIVLALAVVGVLMVPSAALGDKPARGCPDGFTKVTLQGLIGFIQAEIPDAPEEVIEVFFNTFNKNEDAFVCVKPHPSAANAIDNTANQ